MLTPFSLRGSAVVLEPIAFAHVPGLVEAAAEDRSSFSYTNVPVGAEAFEAYVAGNLEIDRTGRQLIFAVRRLADDRVVGSTRFMDLEVFEWPPPWPPGVTHGPVPSNDRPPSVCEIGGTWYAASAQRTVVNTECKLLMLTQAFDAWGVLRVTLKTDSRNERSRSAIARIGASFEGIRRVHSAAVDNTVRDTAYFSIVAPEWPDVRARLIELRDTG